MKVEGVFKIRGSVYLMAWEHKYGTEYSIHTTFEGAQKNCYEIIEEWKEEVIDSSDTELLGKDSGYLFENWTDITHGREYFSIHEIELRD